MTFNKFNALLENNSVKLSWLASEGDDVAGYFIQQSNDAEQWETISYQQKGDNYAGLGAYDYAQGNYTAGRNYYRIVQVSRTGKESYSDIRLIDTRNFSKISIGPNPARDVIYLYNKDNGVKLVAKVFDNSGREVYSTIVAPDQQSINVSRLSKGQYILKLSVQGSVDSQPGYHFIKW